MYQRNKFELNQSTLFKPLLYPNNKIFRVNGMVRERGEFWCCQPEKGGGEQQIPCCSISSHLFLALFLNNYLINNIALNGNQVILHKHSNISLFTGDFLEINIQNKNDLLKWLNNKLFLFFFLVGNYNSSFMCKQLLRYFIVITYNFISNK